MKPRSQMEVLLPELRAYAVFVCASSGDPEDLVQDAIERGLKADARPSRLEELRPWMFRVIRNLHYDELRRRRVRLEYSREQKRLSDEAYGKKFDDADRLIVRDAFSKLSDDHREILFLIDVMGFKYDEAAETLDIARGTVMSRVSRARSEIMSILDQSNITSIGRRQRSHK